MTDGLASALSAAEDSFENFHNFFVVWTLGIDQSLQADRFEHEVGHIRLPEWLLELGKLANGMAGVPSSPTQDKFKRSCVCRLLKSMWCCPDMTQLITNLTLLTCHLCGHAATALVVENVPKYGFVFCGRTRSAHVISHALCKTRRLIHGASAWNPVIFH